MRLTFASRFSITSTPGEPGPDDRPHLILDRVADHADQERTEIAWVAPAQTCGRITANLSARAHHGQQGDRPRRARRIDLGEQPHRDLLTRLAASSEDHPDHRHRAGIGHLRKGLLRFRAASLVLAARALRQVSPVSLSSEHSLCAAPEPRPWPRQFARACSSDPPIS